MSVSIKEDPLRVPILKADGSNWIMYWHKIELVVKSRELLGYLNGKMNQSIDLSIGKDAKWTPTAAKQKALDAYPEKEAKWQKENAWVQALISGSSADSLCMRTRREETAHGVWNVYMKAFEQRSQLFAQDLRRKLQELRYNEKGNLREHFDKLHTIREELAVLGDDVNEKEFANTIMLSLPTSYDSIVMIISTQAKFSSKPLDPEEIMSVFADEYD